MSGPTPCPRRRPDLLSRALGDGAVSDDDRRWLEEELETNLSDLD